MATHRPRKMTFRLSDEEYEEVHHKVDIAGISQQQYLLRSALDQTILNTDDLKSIILELKRIGNNINQIAKLGNAASSLSAEDIAEVKRKEEEIWRLLRQHLQEKGSIKHVIDYVTRSEKTDARLCTGLHCSANTAFYEMQFTKQLFHKTGGRTFLHFIQSFSQDEDITPEEAHQVAFELAEKFSYFVGHEVLIATHRDKQHIHSHFVVNSVSYEDGRKFQMDRKGLQEMKDLSDSLCRKYGLSICEKGKKRSPLTSYSMNKFQLLQKSGTRQS